MYILFTVYATNNTLQCLYSLLHLIIFEKAVQKTGVIQSGPDTAVKLRSTRGSGVGRRDALGFMEKKRCIDRWSSVLLWDPGMSSQTRSMS